MVAGFATLHALFVGTWAECIFAPVATRADSPDRISRIVDAFLGEVARIGLACRVIQYFLLAWRIGQGVAG